MDNLHIKDRIRRIDKERCDVQKSRKRHGRKYFLRYGHKEYTVNDWVGKMVSMVKGTGRRGKLQNK